jgi:hypothetical protein
MKYNIKEAEVVITTDNHKATLLKSNFNKEILDTPILNDLTFSDLQILWKDLYGIPKNIKDILKKKIELYSSSSSINAFIYEGNEYWLDKNDRTSLWNLSNSSLGNLEIVIGDEIVTINSLKLKSFLLKLELYAYKCFVNTFKHLKVVKTLNKLEDIVNYDYTTGYPEKITLE